MRRLTSSLASTLAVALAMAVAVASPLAARADTTPAPFAVETRGTALEDIDHPLAKQAVAWLDLPETQAALELGAVMSRSFAGIKHHPAGVWLDVDIVARHPRHVDAYPAPDAEWPGNGRRPRHHGQGGLGLSRFRLDLPLADDALHPPGAELLSRIELAKMNLQVRASIGDTVALLEDRVSGFRRLYPLGVGALDFIRVPGGITSLTPTTEFGRLDKRNSWEIMTFPKNFQGRPYLPLHIPYLRSGRPPEEAPSLVWRPTWNAFHIWQQPRFARGFLSHGCIRMRDADLLELAAFVWGVETFIPVVIRAPTMPDARHPHWKLTDRYWKLKNIGTEKNPKYWIMNGVWVTEYAAKTAVPEPGAIVGITIDPPKVTALFDPGEPPVMKPGAWSPPTSPEAAPKDGPGRDGETPDAPAAPEP